MTAAVIVDREGGYSESDWMSLTGSVMLKHAGIVCPARRSYGEPIPWITAVWLEQSGLDAVALLCINLDLKRLTS